MVAAEDPSSTLFVWIFTFLNKGLVHIFLEQHLDLSKRNKIKKGK